MRLYPPIFYTHLHCGKIFIIAKILHFLLYIMRDGYFQVLQCFNIFQAFSVVFQKAIERALPAKEVSARVGNLIDCITYSVFMYTSRGLFERDKLIFLSQMAFQASFTKNNRVVDNLSLCVVQLSHYHSGYTVFLPFLRKQYQDCSTWAMSQYHELFDGFALSIMLSVSVTKYVSSKQILNLYFIFIMIFFMTEKHHNQVTSLNAYFKCTFIFIMIFLWLRSIIIKCIF
jgi:hypothetical protein